MLVGPPFLFHPTDEVLSSAKHTGRELDKRSVATKARLFIGNNLETFSWMLWSRDEFMIAVFLLSPCDRE